MADQRVVHFETRFRTKSCAVRALVANAFNPNARQFGHCAYFRERSFGQGLSDPRKSQMPERKVYEMIDKEAPVLAFDVSKGSSHCQGFLSFGKPLGKPVRVRHSKSGMAAAEDISKSLKEKSGESPKVILESTGVYSDPVVHWAESLGLEVFLVSPLESAKVRKSKIRPTKTDALDCGVIAEVAYTRDLRRRSPVSSRYSDLYSVSRRRSAIVRRLVDSKNQYRKNLDAIWPLFDEICDPFSDYALFAVARYRCPERLARSSEERVASALDKANVRLGPVSRAEIAKRLVSYANDVLGGHRPNDAEVRSLMSSLEDVKDDLESLESITVELVNLAKGLDHFPIVSSIDGCGEVLASLLCAEIGEPSRFSSKEGLVAYAGLDPTILQSGRSDGLHYSITRKGNSSLRGYLFLTVENMLIGKSDNQITRFYLKKKSSGLCHKAAATAACRKLLVCIWGMLRSGTLFEK